MDAAKGMIDEVTNGSSYSGVKQLSQMIPLIDIKLDPEFQALFPLDEDMVADVARSIEDSGFDPTQPLVIWKEENILLDGHTRYAAAKRVKLFDVPVFYKSFDSRDAAMYYALGLQLFRRNLSQQQMVLAAKNLFDLGEKMGNPRAKDVRESLTKRLDISERTASKIIAVAKDKDAFEAVVSGEKTVNQAYNDLDKRESHSYVGNPKEESSSDVPEDAEDSASEAVAQEPEADGGSDAGVPEPVGEPDAGDVGMDDSFAIEGDDSDDSPAGEEADDASSYGEDSGEPEESYEDSQDEDVSDGSCEDEEEPVREMQPESQAVRNAPVHHEEKPAPAPAPRAERKPSLPEEDALDDEGYMEDNLEDEAYVEGYTKAFWFVLGQIERKTTVDEILSWFAKRNAFSAEALRAFETPDYIEDIIKGLKGRLKAMANR